MVTIDAKALDRISARADDIHFWRTVLTILAAILYGAGWITYKTFAVTWLAAKWSYAAAATGWDEAKRPKKR